MTTAQSQRQADVQPAADDKDGPHCSWEVFIRPVDDGVTRHAVMTRTTKTPDLEVKESRPDDMIWPAWPVSAMDLPLAGSPLAELEKDWTAASNRLRESAKWMATVLGLALATVVGSSPLADLGSHHLQLAAALILLGGLAFLGLTMLLVLRVMQPQAVSYTDIEDAKPPRFGVRRRRRSRRLRLIPFLASPLYAWRQNIEKHRDLYLPCDVTSLRGLRESMALEQATLMKLAETPADESGSLTGDRLGKVQAARAARLLELRAAAARITSIGECYELKARSTEAMYGGTICGLIGTAAIVLAFAWPLH